MKLALILAAWVVFGFLAYGATYADMRADKYPLSTRDAAGLALFMALLGPGGLFIVMCATGFFKSGLRWRG